MTKSTEAVAFARWLDSAMKSRGMINATLAEITGADPVQVGRWRRGLARPNPFYMGLIARALDGDEAELTRLAWGTDSNLPDSEQAIVAEHRFWQARYDYIIEHKIPWKMREAYLSACEALADVFSGALSTGEQPSLNGSPSENGNTGPRPEDHRLTDCFPAVGRSYSSRTPSLVGAPA